MTHGRANLCASGCKIRHFSCNSYLLAKRDAHPCNSRLTSWLARLNSDTWTVGRHKLDSEGDRVCVMPRFCHVTSLVPSAKMPVLDATTDASDTPDLPDPFEVQRQ